MVLAVDDPLHIETARKALRRLVPPLPGHLIHAKLVEPAGLGRAIVMSSDIDVALDPLHDHDIVHVPFQVSVDVQRRRTEMQPRAVAAQRWQLATASHRNLRVAPRSLVVAQIMGKLESRAE